MRAEVLSPTPQDVTAELYADNPTMGDKFTAQAMNVKKIKL